MPIRISQGENVFSLDPAQPFTIDASALAPPVVEPPVVEPPVVEPPPPPAPTPPDLIVNAGTDIILLEDFDSLPAVAVLSGVIGGLDPELPISPSIRWTQLSGPMATISAPEDLTTSVRLSTFGTYAFALEVSYGGHVFSDLVEVSVAAENQPPVVTAGPDLEVVTGRTFSLVGGVTDDGLTESLETQWSVDQIDVGRAPNIEFGNALRPSTTVIAREAGTYVFRLSASDGEFTVEDSATVVVRDPTSPPTAPRGLFRMGTNILAPTWYDQSVLYSNRILYASSWMGSRDFGWNNAPLELDATGMPTRLEPGVEAVAIFPDVTRDEYTLTWEGSGHIRLDGAPGYRVLEERPNYVRFQGGGYRANQGVMTIRVSSLPVGNIQIRKTGIMGDGLVDPLYARYIRHNSGFRFMDLGNTNRAFWTSDPNIVEWSQRTRPDRWNGWGPDGLSYEAMLQLCEVFDSEFAWFCVPHTASDDYIRQMATLLRNQTPAHMQLYIEWSNEPWNWDFHARGFLQADAERLGISHFAALGRRIENMVSIFEEVFGGTGMDRVYPVVNHVSGTDVRDRDQWEAIYGQEFRYIFGEGLRGRAKALTVPMYFGHGAASTDLDTLFARCSADIQAIERTLPWLAELADELGVELTCYEGGQHVMPGTEANRQAAVYAAQNDSRMGALYDHLLDSWHRHGGGVFCHFTGPGTHSPHGAFGIVEDCNTTEVGRNPKFEALTRAWVKSLE